MPGVTVTRVLPGEDPTVGAAFTAAVNMVLASPVECPDVPVSEEQTELRRIWKMNREVAVRKHPRLVHGRGVRACWSADERQGLPGGATAVFG